MKPYMPYVRFAVGVVLLVSGAVYLLSIASDLVTHGGIVLKGHPTETMKPGMTLWVIVLFGAMLFAGADLVFRDTPDE